MRGLSEVLGERREEEGPLDTLTDRVFIQLLWRGGEIHHYIVILLLYIAQFILAQDWTEW